jgi:hypothetical protein
LLGSVATPAAVILAVPAPRPLDFILAWPLVLIDVWMGPASSGGMAEQQPATGTPLRVAALLAGIALTWLHYVLLARLALWRTVAGHAEEESPTFRRRRA